LCCALCVVCSVVIWSCAPCSSNRDRGFD
jgi:hypothetical protein